MIKKNIYVVFVNYNGYEDTINAIKSLRKNDSLEIKIVVVDNASTNNSVKKLKELCDEYNFTLLISEKNLGFAGGNNIGINYSLKKGADYVMLLNNDTEIEKDAITIMADELTNNNEVGAVGSKILNYFNKEKIEYLGGHYNMVKMVTIHDYYGKKDNEINVPDFIYTDFITGCSIMIKKEVLEKVGLLPEEYFMYFEDADYCIRMIENGYKLGVCSKSIIYHKVSASGGGNNSPFAIEWYTKNRYRFYKKYKKYSKGIITKLSFIPTKSLINVIGNKEKKHALFKGIKDGLKILRNN